jgi:hypothetical protein
MDACGGPIAAADHCRLEKSQLSRFGQPETGQFMPADVIVQLEARAGSPIYSLAMAEFATRRREADDLVSEALQTTEEAAELQRVIRVAAADGEITPAERRRIRRGVLSLLDQVRELDAATDPGQDDGGAS